MGLCFIQMREIESREHGSSVAILPDFPQKDHHSIGCALLSRPTRNPFGELLHKNFLLLPISLLDFFICICSSVVWWSSSSLNGRKTRKGAINCLLLLFLVDCAPEELCLKRPHCCHKVFCAPCFLNSPFFYVLILAFTFWCVFRFLQ
jgi:hypothetical protein